MWSVKSPDKTVGALSLVPVKIEDNVYFCAIIFTLSLPVGRQA
jgi:hypothetical protein